MKDADPALVTSPNIREKQFGTVSKVNLDIAKLRHESVRSDVPKDARVMPYEFCFDCRIETTAALSNAATI